MIQRRNIDWLGFWYDLLEERGQNHHIYFRELDRDLTTIRSYKFHHGRKDGAGSLSHIIRSGGHQNFAVPTGRDSKQPSWSERWQIMRLALANMKSKAKPKWITWDTQRSAKPENIDTIAFSKDETKALLSFCKQKKLSLSAVLLDSVNRCVLPELLTSQANDSSELQGRWLFPVNMRGAVNKLDDESNHSSAVYLDYTSCTTAQDLHRQIKSLLTQKIHWGIWWLAHIGRICGRRMMRRLSRNSAKTSFYLGTFSNMGAWSNPDAAANPENRWAVAAPGSLNYPIGIVCLIWNDQLTLTLKINCGILSDQQLKLSFAAQIRQYCLAKASIPAQ